ncbi:MAG: hypothetical protein ABRQ27_05475, partial [Clostridiaceae bacterium]
NIIFVKKITITYSHYFNFFLVNTQSLGIYILDISLNNWIVNYITDSLYDLPRKNESLNYIVSSTYNIAKKYKVDKIHKLSETERLYLQIASILHDNSSFFEEIIGIKPVI